MICNACKKGIRKEPVYDMFDRPLHAKCHKKTNMAPELALLLRACVQRLGGGVLEFSIEDILQSPPVGFTKDPDTGTISINSRVYMQKAVPETGKLVSYCVLDAKGYKLPQAAPVAAAYDSLKDAVEHGRKLEGSVIAVVDVEGHIERFIDPSV